MINFIMFFNAIACFVVGYVTLGLLLQMRRPESWKGWLERVCMAAVVGASVFAGLAPFAIGYVPFAWTIIFNCTMSLWFGIMFQRTSGWKKHVEATARDTFQFLKNLPLRVDHAKMCWNNRVDRVRGAK